MIGSGPRPGMGQASGSVSVGTAVARERQIVSCRSTPERIDVACQAATRNRLIGVQVTPETADA